MSSWLRKSESGDVGSGSRCRERKADDATKGKLLALGPAWPWQRSKRSVRIIRLLLEGLGERPKISLERESALEEAR